MDAEVHCLNAIRGHKDGAAATSYGETAVKVLYREICKIPRMEF